MVTTTQTTSIAGVLSQKSLAGDISPGSRRITELRSFLTMNCN